MIGYDIGIMGGSLDERGLAVTIASFLPLLGARESLQKKIPIVLVKMISNGDCDWAFESPIGRRVEKVHKGPNRNGWVQVSAQIDGVRGVRSAKRQTQAKKKGGRTKDGTERYLGDGQSPFPPCDSPKIRLMFYVLYAVVIGASNLSSASSAITGASPVE
jgi:hypothetical protein